MRLADVLADEPWCAGVDVVRDGRRLLTVQLEGETAVARWIGGGRLGDESCAACAVREAREEIGVDVALVQAEATVVARGVDAELVERVVLEDLPAPVLVHRYPDPMHVVLFRGRADGEPRPVEEPRLLWAPLEALDLLAGGVAVAELDSLGAERLGEPLPAGAVVRLGPTERLVHRLGLR